MHRRRRLRIRIDAARRRRRRRLGHRADHEQGRNGDGPAGVRRAAADIADLDSHHVDGCRQRWAGDRRAGAASAKDDGSFELKGLTGLRLIRLGNAPSGWTLKSVKLNGTDITDTGAEFKPGETTSGLEVELTNRSTSVNGSVTASDGSLLKDYTVVIFSETPEQWRLPMTRWVTGTRPDQDGRFKVQNLPAGNYLAVAVDYVPQGEWGDPELLDRLKSKAKRFTLGDGATHTLDLKLTGEY